MKAHSFNLLITFCLSLMSFQVFATDTHNSTALSGPDGWQIFNELQAGNQRFSSNQPKYPMQDDKTKNDVANGQKPHTIVLSCSDSRVPPELVFDQGLGQLFVVRTAGHVPDSAAIASIEYAIEHLGARLLLVMGHESCGAVKAALTTPKGQTAGSPDLDRLVQVIKPGVTDYLSTYNASDKTMRPAVQSNVAAMARLMVQKSKIIREAFLKQRLLLAQGVYSLNTRKVDFTFVGEPMIIQSRAPANTQTQIEVPVASTAEKVTTPKSESWHSGDHH